MKLNTENGLESVSGWYPSMIDLCREAQGYHVKRFYNFSDIETKCAIFGEPLIFKTYQAAKDYADKLNKMKGNYHGKRNSDI